MTPSGQYWWTAAIAAYRSCLGIQSTLAISNEVIILTASAYSIKFIDDLSLLSPPAAFPGQELQHRTGAATLHPYLPAHPVIRCFLIIVQT